MQPTAGCMRNAVESMKSPFQSCFVHFSRFLRVQLVFARRYMDLGYSEYLKGRQGSPLKGKMIDLQGACLKCSDPRHSVLYCI